MTKRRTCQGCGELKPIAGTRGPRIDKRVYCAECLAVIDGARPTPLELLSKALPHVPADLAESIRQRISPQAYKLNMSH